VIGRNSIVKNTKKFSKQGKIFRLKTLYSYREKVTIFLYIWK